MASDDGLKPVIDDLLAVGLSLVVGDGYSGKSSFVYQILEEFLKELSLLVSSQLRKLIQ